MVFARPDAYTAALGGYDSSLVTAFTFNITLSTNTVIKSSSKEKGWGLNGTLIVKVISITFAIYKQNFVLTYT